jgi:hypothetical protein
LVFVDETKELLSERGVEVDHVAIYRTVDQHGQVIDIFVSKRRNTGLLEASSTRSGVRTAGPSRSSPISLLLCCG